MATLKGLSMHIKSGRAWQLRESEVTDESVYRARREFIKTAGLVAAGVLVGPRLAAAKTLAELRKLKPIEQTKYNPGEKLNTYEQITSYNNYYEFGFEKSDPARLAPSLRVSPWSVRVSGEAEVTGTYSLEDLIRPYPLEERIYRHRCVEAWSMVIPWVGFPLSALIKRFKPTSRAKFVEFTTLYDPAQMPGQRTDVLAWPYVEGLRMDEAMNELAIIAVGLYGKELPGQDGAPIRLVVPWKYGFKSIKSIVRIHFRETMPATTWAKAAPAEYGFYANVNPHVDHPRWSQARERRIGEFFKRPTLMFNGYGEYVADLYKGMDLRKYF